MSVITIRDVAIQCDSCEQPGPAATSAVEARYLAIEEGWQVSRLSSKPDFCADCLAREQR
jgi:hypothetical protein